MKTYLFLPNVHGHTCTYTHTHTPLHIHNYTHMHTHNTEGNSPKRQQVDFTKVDFGKGGFMGRESCFGSQTKMPGRNTSESLGMEK